jgi:AcrR family transcriptional regulator
MVQIAHSGVNENKIEEIVVAAQKRFGIFGYGKTAMHEIAEDLSISKASLYYYFPDKDSLFRAVFEKEKEEFIRNLHEAIDKSDNAETLLYEFLELRMKNFRNLNNLARAGLEDIKNMKKALKDLWIRFREREQEEIKRIFLLGIEKQQFKIQENVDQLADLYLDSLRGLSHVCLKNRDISYIGDVEFDQISKKTTELTQIFIKAISV